MNSRRTNPYSALPFALLHRPEDTSVVTLPVPGYRQVRNYCCGFATALMVLRHFEHHVSARELFEALGTARDGTAQTAIIRVLREQGVRANIRYDANFERMADCINAGKVLIGYLEDEEHWLVIYGYGRAPQRIYVADPEPEKDCEHLWQEYGARLGNFAIVCSAPTPGQVHKQEPAAAPASDSLQLSFDFGPAT